MCHYSVEGKAVTMWPVEGRRVIKHSILSGHGSIIQLSDRKKKGMPAVSNLLSSHVSSVAWHGTHYL